MPFDYKKQKWAASSHWYWQALAIKPDKLVDLIPVGEQLGKITPKASKKTGIPVGLPLIASAADKACEVLGAGSLEPLSHHTLPPCPIFIIWNCRSIADIGW